MNETESILENMLISEEGFRPFVYDDATGAPIKPGSLVSGHPTIGFGLALDVNPLTREEGLALLRPRYLKGLNDLRRSFGWFGKMNPSRQAVLGGMVYQLGFSGFLKFPKLIDACQQEQWNMAEVEMLDSLWATKTPERAKRLARIMKDGK